MTATETKFFEVRDSGTHIPIMATLLTKGESWWCYQMRRAGWGPETKQVFVVVNLLTMESQYDNQEWKSRRTMPNAHRFIEENWETLTSGDVIDVEYILGDTTVKKITEEINE